jgi:hypothetical protein
VRDPQDHVQDAQEAGLRGGSRAECRDLGAGGQPAGAAVLAAQLAPAGFAFELTAQGIGSGGRFATGRFTRDDQYLELHVRRSLGLVTYGWGDDSLSHGDYQAGLGAGGAYPGFGADVLDGFRHLAQDLAGPLSGFVTGDRDGYDRSLRAAGQPRRRSLPCCGCTRARPSWSRQSVPWRNEPLVSRSREFRGATPSDTLARLAA